MNFKTTLPIYLIYRVGQILFLIELIVFPLPAILTTSTSMASNHDRTHFRNKSDQPKHPSTTTPFIMISTKQGGYIIYLLAFK